MQHLTPLDVAQRALRARICRECFKRLPGSETLGPNEARSCEPECTVFLHLPRILEIAAEVRDPTLGPYDHAVRELICQVCNASPTSGDYCSERSTVNCPLARYLGEVVDTLESLGS